MIFVVHDLNHTGGIVTASSGTSVDVSQQVAA